ncbi:hypothetical protein [Streptomyces sp. enrichment culture]|uniref:hypothetical protein n=1 Tax=Streptomyces sp. enrichment culture TaxID=1795815 RepID=UPI003F54F88E
MTFHHIERTALAVVAALLADADLDADDGPLSLLDGYDREQLLDVLVAVTALLVREWTQTAAAAGLDRARLLAAVRVELARLAGEEPPDEP